MLRLRWTTDGGGRPAKQISNQKEGGVNRPIRWTTDGGGRPAKQISNQKEGRSEPTKHSPMVKLVSQGWNSNLILEFSVQRFFLPLSCSDRSFI